MLKTIPAAEAKNKFGLLMDTVQREAVAISKKGRTSAIMMPVHEYEEYKQLKLEKLKRHVAEGIEQANRGETTIINSEDELHLLLTSIKQENRSKEA
ncbi:MAG: type II toxin-antitoxin system Phd/YefM family antitoxin [Pseudomonadales bacterium]|nr:type II toxin-antitoxin system Phd/YefM family antitoxin [Pseudomonadales bacterium]